MKLTIEDEQALSRMMQDCGVCPVLAAMRDILLAREVSPQWTVRPGEQGALMGAYGMEYVAARLGEILKDVEDMK